VIKTLFKERFTFSEQLFGQSQVALEIIMRNIYAARKELLGQLPDLCPWSKMRWVEASGPGTFSGLLKSSHRYFRHCSPFIYLDFESNLFRISAP